MRHWARHLSPSPLHILHSLLSSISCTAVRRLPLSLLQPARFPFNASRVFFLSLSLAPLVRRRFPLTPSSLLSFPPSLQTEELQGKKLWGINQVSWKRWTFWRGCSANLLGASARGYKNPKVKQFRIIMQISSFFILFLQVLQVQDICRSMSSITVSVTSLVVAEWWKKENYASAQCPFGEVSIPLHEILVFSFNQRSHPSLTSTNWPR